MHYLKGNVAITGKLLWDYYRKDIDDKEGLQISFNVDKFSHSQGKLAIEYIKKVVKDNDLGWIVPDEKVWIVDLDKLRKDIPELSEIPWFRKKAYVEPEFMGEDVVRHGKQRYTAKVILNIYNAPHCQDTKKF